jgi:hypothetical protein
MFVCDCSVTIFDVMVRLPICCCRDGVTNVLHMLQHSTACMWHDCTAESKLLACCFPGVNVSMPGVAEDLFLIAAGDRWCGMVFCCMRSGDWELRQRCPPVSLP